MSTWSYNLNGQACGPADTTELQNLLRNGTLGPDALVWQQGMTDWVPARTVPELASAIPAAGTTPPPLPGSAASAASAPPQMLGSGASAEADDIAKNKIFAVLAYIGILFLVPLLAAPQSKFARYHANQGAVLFLAAVVLLVGSGVLTMVPVVGCLSAIVAMVTCVGAFVLMILGIINASSGVCKPLPLIGQYRLIQ
jgi:uncharacterized membrane protein